MSEEREAGFANDLYAYSTADNAWAAISDSLLGSPPAGRFRFALPRSISLFQGQAQASTTHALFSDGLSCSQLLV